jgi:hypothetical protein
VFWNAKPEVQKTETTTKSRCSGCASVLYPTRAIRPEGHPSERGRSIRYRRQEKAAASSSETEGVSD